MWYVLCVCVLLVFVQGATAVEPVQTLMKKHVDSHTAVMRELAYMRCARFLA